MTVILKIYVKKVSAFMGDLSRDEDPDPWIFGLLDPDPLLFKSDPDPTVKSGSGTLPV